MKPILQKYLTGRATLVMMICCQAGSLWAAKGNVKKPKGPSAQKSSASSKGVVTLFSEAQKLFNAGQFNEALIAFDRIIRKYPAHEPSIIQYAKTLYRLDRIPESYNLFARINPQYLDPETSYEYGYSSYVNQRWDAALFGFKRVSPDHALYDLANYYGAICAIKLKKYADAEEMLDKAVVLPDKLSKSRSLYQKHVQALKHLQEKADLEQATAAEKNRLNQSKITSKNSAPNQGGAPSKQETTAYQHNGFLTVDRLAKLKVAKEHQTIDKHGFSQTNYDNQVSSFEFSYGPIAQLPMKKSGENTSAVGLQMDLAIQNRNTSGRQERIVVYADSRDIPRTLGDDIPATQTNIGTFGGRAWIEFSLPNSWWMGLSSLLSFEYPEFKRGQRTSKRSASPHLGRQFKFGPHSGSVLSTFTYEQLTDSETEPLVDTSTGNLAVELAFASDTTFTATCAGSQFKYQILTMGGPDDIYSGSAKIAQKFPLGIVISAKGTAAQQKNNIVRGLPSFEVASANGTTLSGNSKIEVTPVPWLSVTAQYDASKTTWQVQQADREDAYKKNVADYVDQTSISASLNFKF
ncbi:MAG: tetratricopeptide repeat protein [Proteobacteria bacterium]|nr:tetratricopeptide repeat protein [Pseudomonadota bacterium]